MDGYLNLRHATIEVPLLMQGLQLGEYLLMTGGNFDEVFLEGGNVGGRFSLDSATIGP